MQCNMNSARQTMTTGAHVESLFRYPIKGMTPERLDKVEVRTGATLPFDRAYAIENGHGRFDPDAPRHLPKINFLMLMRDERLAKLQSQFDEDTQTLVIKRDGKQVARGQLTTNIGRQMIEQFLGAYMKGSLRGAPKIVHADGHSFSDVAAKCVHIVNLASLRELERAVGKPVHPLRFRANVYLDGLSPWAEFGWLGKDIELGSIKAHVFKRTVRCDATNVEPVGGERDMAIPATLQRTWGHSDFGVYATIQSDGTLSVGDNVKPAA